MEDTNHVLVTLQLFPSRSASFGEAVILKQGNATVALAVLKSVKSEWLLQDCPSIHVYL